MPCRSSISILQLIVAATCLVVLCGAAPLPHALRLSRHGSPGGSYIHIEEERDPNPPWLQPDTTSFVWLYQRIHDWWRGGPEPLERIIVEPLLPNGTRASPAALYLPKSVLLEEKNYLESAVAPWEQYNTSQAVPLVPAGFAWMADDMKMHGRATEGQLDIDVARALSRLVAASYCNVPNLPSWNCSRCGDNFTPRRVVFDPLWDLLGFAGWSEELDAVVVAFRGTDSHSYYNWVENMRTWRTDLALTLDGIPPHALVHGGFFYSYNGSYLAGNLTAAVAEIVAERQAHARGGGGGGGGGGWLWPSGGKSKKKKDDNSTSSDDDNVGKLGTAPTVFVTGHSLGGALATLCALDLHITLGIPDVRVVSFGSPRVGNYVFAKWFEEEIGPHWRFTHNRDIVPSVPPGYMGFYHVAQEVWVVDMLGRTLVGVCDDSGEDARCHNSMCHLGLCSSVADHLLYLSEMYSPHPMGC